MYTAISLQSVDRMQLNYNNIIVYFHFPEGMTGNDAKMLCLFQMPKNKMQVSIFAFTLSKIGMKRHAADVHVQFFIDHACRCGLFARDLVKKS